MQNIIGERLRTLRKALGMTQEQFSGVLGIGKAALSMIETGKARLSPRNKNVLVQKLNVSPEWLDTGMGRMTTDDPDEDVFLPRTGGESPLQCVPLFSGSLSSKTSDQIRIQIPNLSRCDGAIRVIGDSMAPLLKSGDIVLYKQLKDIGDLFWGDMYLLSLDIDGEEYVTVKYIQKSARAGYIRLVSQNPNHADKEIPLERLRVVAQIKASVRLN